MIISNSSPLIFLAKINKLFLLKDLYKEIIIPQAVYKEVIVTGKIKQYGDAYIIEKALGDSIIIKEVKGKMNSQLQKFLGDGEREAIELALEQKSKLLPLIQTR